MEEKDELFIPIDSGSRFRTAGRGSADSGRGGSPVYPHRCDGRHVRAQHYGRDSGGAGSAPVHGQDSGRASDGGGAGTVCSSVRGRRGGYHYRSRGGDHSSGPNDISDQRTGRAGRCGFESGHSDFRAGKCAAVGGYGFDHDGQSGFRRTDADSLHAG